LDRRTAALLSEAEVEADCMIADPLRHRTAQEKAKALGTERRPGCGCAGGCSQRPWPAGVRKLADRLEGWRMRVGDYRVLYQIDNHAQTVTVVQVRHRREVFR
jgi:mRNA-degrading endonuclease RelE of RelBE toxin-antitoxin system